MPFDNEAAKRALIQLLRGSRRAVLLVGAGSSIPVGYPSWPQLLEELRTAVVPELVKFPDVDLILAADDYASRYGIPRAVVNPDEALAQPTRPLDTLHRKVVWSLLTMYPVVCRCSIQL